MVPGVLDGLRQAAAAAGPARYPGGGPGSGERGCRYTARGDLRKRGTARISTRLWAAVPPASGASPLLLLQPLRISKTGAFRWVPGG